jgi:hypothetical protein
LRGASPSRQLHTQAQPTLWVIHTVAGRLADVVQDASTASGLAPGRPVLEVTESVLLQHSDDRRAMLHRLRTLGIRIALDDFGTGYSSLSYLRSVPFGDQDRSVVHPRPRQQAGFDGGNRSGTRARYDNRRGRRRD